MGEGGREIVCGKSLLFFLIKKALAGDRIVMISPRSRIHALFCVAGFPPAVEPLLFRQKWPKPVTPRLASKEGRDANLRRAAQLAGLKQGPP
jgi:hypothetical protein